MARPRSRPSTASIWSCPARTCGTSTSNSCASISPRRGSSWPKGADQPGRGGKSSGVARILKYAEKMVFIYSLKENKLSDNLDLIRPNEKIVVFNISRLDSILRTLDAEKIKKVHLDKDTLTLE